MLSYVFIDGFTRLGRTESLMRLKEAVAHADGAIVDFAFFSNKAVRLSVELEAGALGRLREGLDKAGVELFDACARILDAEAGSTSTRPLLALLHVTFAAEEGDLAVEVPQVPG